MAVWSEIEISDSTITSRLDAEFFQPKYIHIVQQLEGVKARPLSNYAVDIRYGLNVPPDYVQQGLPFLRALNLKEYGIEGEILNIPYTPEDVGEINLLKEGDLLIVRSGANVGDIGITTANIVGATFGSYTIRVRPTGINPYYLYVFLKCYYGREQTVRYRSGAAQPNISMPNLRDVLVYCPSELKQREVEHLLFNSYSKREEAKFLYTEAESLLLSALQLDTLDLSHQLTYEANFEDLEKAGRYDAEYFQPKYQRTLAVLGKSGQNIRDVAHLAKRPFRAPADQDTFQYIEIGNLTADGVAQSETVLCDEAPSRAQWIVQPNDVITSTVRPIRRLSALIEENQSGFVCSSGFAVLQPYSVPPEVLLVYLRLPIVCEILDLHTTASMYPAIATETLMQIPITLPDDYTQKQVISKVQEARQARQEAVALLEQAKRQVEAMILRGE